MRDSKKFDNGMKLEMILRHITCKNEIREEEKLESGKILTNEITDETIETVERFCQMS